MPITDEDLKEIHRFELEPDAADVSAIARELLIRRRAMDNVWTEEFTAARLKNAECELIKEGIVNGE